jgi:heme/copper-type cytochrome/quinol oxidase subunit 1
MAESLRSQRTRTLAYIAIGIGLLALALCCGLAILPGTMGVDTHFTESYFVVAHFHWLRLFGMVIGIAGVTIFARTLYARFIGS